MSVTGLSTRGIPNSLTGLETINASYNAKFVPYVGASTTVNLGAQNITTTHQATNSFDLVNLQVLTNAIDFVNTANALTYLNKVTTNAQTVKSIKVGFEGAIEASSAAIFDELTCNYATANKVPIFDANKKLVSSGVDAIKITYLDNVSSDIQTQLNGKASLTGPQTFTGTHTFSAATPINLSGLTASRVLQLDASGNVQVSSVTTTELGYVSGVTSSIQTQLNGKANTSALANYLPLAGGTMSGDIQMTTRKLLFQAADIDVALSTSGSNFYKVEAAKGSSYRGMEYWFSQMYFIGNRITYANRAANPSQAQFIIQDNTTSARLLLGTYYTGGQGTGSFIQSSDYYSSADHGTELLLNPLGGNIGIGGVIDPTAPLHVKASGGGNPSANGIYVHNGLNSAGQDAIVTVRTAGSSGGNPYISFDVAAEAGWSWGMDNADNSMKLSYSWSSLTSNTKMTMNTSGRLGIGCNPTAPLTAGSITIVDGAATPGVYQPGCIYTDVNWGMLFRAAVSANIAHMRWDRYDGTTIMKIQNTGVLNFTGGGSNYAVDNGLTTRAGAVVIGNLSTNYDSAWQAGLLFECADNTEIQCHDSGNRVVSMMFYQGASVNRFYIGRDIGWGKTPISLEGRVAINGQADTTAQLCVTNPNGTITHFGYSNNYNYIRGALTQIDTPTRVSNWVEATEFYTNNWFRINNNNAGLYWENLGRGIRSPEGEGTSYGTVTTIGNGRNNWSGYGIGTRYSFMKYDYSSEWGIHDNSYSWLIYGDGGSNRPVVLGGGGVRASRDWDIFVVFRNYFNFDGGYFYVNTGGGYGMASDSRIKKNIEEISQDQSIIFIKNVKPASFCMQDPKPVKQTKPDGTEEEFTPSFCNCKEDGFIAQNILESAKLAGISKKVCNHWFDYEEEMKKPIEEQEVKQENILGVNDRPILSHAVNAIKHLLEKVDKLEQRLIALESRSG